MKTQQKREQKIEDYFTDKELFIIWNVVCCFDKPATSVLKYKLYSLLGDDKVRKLRNIYESKLDDQFFKDNRPLSERGLI